MVFFLNLIKAKWVFKKPGRKKILVYDRVSESFSKIIFPKNDYEILDVRYESINMYVLLLTLLKLNHINFKDNYKKIYLNLVAPKIVYTSIDNNMAFFKLKNLYGKAVYISDQNGMRKNDFYKECAKYNLNTKDKLGADHIFLFGQNDKKRISMILNGKIHVLGNTKNNNYPIIERSRKKMISSIMFICSAVDDDAFEKDKKIFKNLNTFCIKKNIKLYFCSRYGFHKKDFHKKNYAKGNWIYLPRINVSSTYKYLNKQQMVVFSHSSLGYEGLSKGLKCAVFHESFPIKGNPIKYPKSGVFWSNSKNYYDLEKVLNRVINFPNKRWKKIALRYSNEILNYDPMNIKKKKIIRKALL